MKDYCKLAEDYCEEILSGKTLACDWVRRACQRQVDDLKRDWEYYFDRDAANACCRFLSLLKHVQGDKAGQRFILEKWQAFAVTCVMGWRRKDNGKRRFRRFFCECPKGSGKSFLSSGLALFFLCADGQHGATCVAAARATNQARLVFDTARDICRANKELCDAFGLKVLTHSISQPSSASTFLPVSAEGKNLAGKLIHFASCDELEFHRDRTVLDEVQLGCDKLSNSLCSMIQHPGENLLSPGYEMHVAATKVLSGQMVDERLWCVIYSAEGVPWDSPEAITMSNPNLGVSVYEQTLREAQARAISIPALKPAFCSHNLGLWEDGTVTRQWISKEVLAPCREKNLTLESYRLWAVGEHQAIIAPDMLRPFVVGVERSSLQERAAVVFATKGYLDGVENFYLFAKYFDSEANSDEQLADAILACYRNHIGYGVTEHDADGFSIKALAHDSYLTPSPRLEKSGISAVPFTKTPRTFSAVMDWMMSLALVGRIHFSDDDEILASHLLGIYAKRDLNSNLFPRRANPDKPIDAAIASLYALRLAMAPNFLAPPEVSDIKAIFLWGDGSVSESSPNGLVQTRGPLVENPRGAHPGDLQ